MVYLVGAGPGDAGLITLRGRAVLRRARVILYDYLAPAELLDLAPAAAERIYVGKSKGCHSREQNEINALLVGRGRQGGVVVRLKGGDPYIFGRGGEEAQALAGAGIPFQVIPGVPSPIGLAAYCGVPLTHRDFTSSLRFVSGHDVARVDWARTDPRETLVVFMGLTTFPEIARALLAAGRSPATPAMAVRWATTTRQQVVAGTLDTLAAEIARVRLKAPATIVIGDVVRLRGELDWFGRLPLAGRRFAVTGTAGTSALRRRGAEVVRLPVVGYLPLEDTAALDSAIARLPGFAGVVFRSPEAVRFFLDRIAGCGLDARAFRGWIRAEDYRTARALRASRLVPDAIGAGAGARADVLVVGEGGLAPYRVAAVPELRERTQALLSGSDSRPEWLMFTCPAEVSIFVEACGSRLLDGVPVAAIGPVTLSAARGYGIPAVAFDEALRNAVENGAALATC
jgi:uroporphyrinogen III methyltransferase/synthase